MNQKYDRKKISETVKRIASETSDEKGMERIAAYVRKTIEASEVHLLEYSDFPAEVIESVLNDNFVYISSEFSEMSLTSLLPLPSNGWKEVSSLLFFPFQIEASEVEKLFVFYGAKAHQQEEEEIVPLKSAGKTIGVTVRQTVKEIPDRVFGEDEIALLREVMKVFSMSNSKKPEKTKIKESDDGATLESHFFDENSGNPQRRSGILEKIKSIFK